MTQTVINAILALLSTNAELLESGISVVDVSASPAHNIYIVVDCFGSPFNGTVVDLCGICNGTNTCIDCTGLYGGDLKTDPCGVCGGIAASTSDCIEIGSPECQDNTDFLDETGMSCDDWRGYSCVTATRDWQMSEVGMFNLLRNCPYSCRQCIGACVDDSAFLDEAGMPCTAWMGYDCNTAGTEWFYSEMGQAELLTKCPYSCMLCGDSDSNPTPTPTPNGSDGIQETDESSTDDEEEPEGSGAVTLAVGVGVGAACSFLLVGGLYAIKKRKERIHNARVVCHPGETTL
jgi:hypothetical protein